jgi:ADP-ribosylglycohydrolase
MSTPLSTLAHNYESQVYAAVLGKVIGVYMGRPFEGWSKERLVATWGLVDRYVADDCKVPLVVADDDITGTFTFIRALEDTGRYADTPDADFGKMWLNYIIEGKSILWWGGLGVSTEHTAFCRLKAGVPAPESGSIARNGQIVAEQIGAQIFIDAFGMVAPGDPQLAVKLAERSARVSHDGEAVYGALVVAAMVSAAFVEKDMERLLDVGVSVIPPDCLIAQVHRDVRAWCREDGNWHATYERIKAQYGYDKYGGGCHMIPNHAIMVMAWAYAEGSFRRSQAIINTAGWDTDCNAANVGTVMGLVCGIEGINAEYDFQSPMADRVLLPTAEGTRHISDCLLEAGYIARMGRRIMGWPELPAPKDGAWHHFSQPGARHGWMAEPSEHGMALPITVRNVDRMLGIAARDLAPNCPARVSTPLMAEPNNEGYALMGTPRLYPGQTVTLSGVTVPGIGVASLRLFVRHYAPGIDKPALAAPTGMAYSEPVPLGGEGPFSVSLTIPDLGAYPAKDLGVEIVGDGGASGGVRIDRVSYDGTPCLTIAGDVPRNEARALLGWVVDADSVQGRYSHDTQPITYLRRNVGRGHMTTGAADWTNYAVSATVKLHCADAAGIIARYQGLERYYALVKTANALQLVRRYYGDTILAEMPCAWEPYSLHALALRVDGARLTASLDGQVVLEATDDILTGGGAGFLTDTGIAGFAGFAVAP